MCRIGLRGCIGFAMAGQLLLASTAIAGNKDSKCRSKKAQTKEKKTLVVAQEQPPVKPVPDPVPQNVQSQVKFLTSGLSDLPPDPKPGECYVRVKQAAEYKIVRDKVLIREETIRYDVVPAKFKVVEKKILVRPETVRFEIIPEKFEKKDVEVVLTPWHAELTATETKFKEDKKQFEVLAVRVYWKRGVAPIDGNKNMTDDILCLVREKPQFKDYVLQRVANEASLNEKRIDKKTQTVSTQVLVQPARVKEIKVPAEYKTITVRELVSPASKKKVVVPAEYKEFERQVLLEQERMVWQRVLCDTNVTESMIKQVQTELKRSGFDPGQHNGRLTKQTCDAMKQYQKKHKLSEGALTYEFLNHIGVQP